MPVSAGIGALLGGFGGGAGGAALCAAGGPVAIACAAGGGVAGAGKGALWGAAVGGAIDTGILMFSRQGDAVTRAESIRDGKRGINAHMNKLRANPNSTAANYWAREIRGRLKEVERLTGRMRGKTQQEWRRWIDEVRRELDNLVGGH